MGIGEVGEKIKEALIRKSGIRVVRVSSDMAATNDLLRSLIIEQRRTADALNAILLHAFNVDLNPAPLPIEEDPERPRIDEIDDEAVAAIEAMEDRGIDIPADVYRRYGLDKPDDRHSTEEPEFQLFDDQGNQGDEESAIVSTRKQLDDPS
jgi:transcriptional regulator of met regulon